LILVNGRKGQDHCRWTQDEKEVRNRYIEKPRLSTFIILSEGGAINSTVVEKTCSGFLNEINFIGEF
jgi:hypothetical protein